MTGLRKFPRIVLRKMVALALWIRGKDDIEENSTKYFEKNGSFRTLDLRKR